METLVKLRHPNRTMSLCGAFPLSCLFLFAIATAVPAQATDVLTYHNDNGRTGQNVNE